MGMDKAIEHGKEHRKQYHGAKAVDKTCRNHGSCPYCSAGRKHREMRQTPIVDDGIYRVLHCRHKEDK